MLLRLRFGRDLVGSVEIGLIYQDLVGSRLDLDEISSNLLHISMRSRGISMDMKLREREREGERENEG